MVLPQKNDMTERLFLGEGPLQNNLDEIALRLGSDLDGTIEKMPRHRTTMVRFFRLRRVQRCPEDGRRDV